MQSRFIERWGSSARVRGVEGGGARANTCKYMDGKALKRSRNTARGTQEKNSETGVKTFH